MKRKSAIIVLTMLCFLCFGSFVSAQTVSDTTQQRLVASHMTSVDTLVDELVFDPIEIQGKVDRPGVIIMPKRIEPEIGEIELERSFQKEVKEGIGEIPKPEDELRRLERVKSIKKTVERKRK